jgi:hypothetical protein
MGQRTLHRTQRITRQCLLALVAGAMPIAVCCRASGESVAPRTEANAGPSATSPEFPVQTTDYGEILALAPGAGGNSGQARGATLLTVHGTVMCRTRSGLMRPVTSFDLYSVFDAASGSRQLSPRQFHRGEGGAFTLDLALTFCAGHTVNEQGEAESWNATSSESFAVKAVGCNDTEFIIGADDFQKVIEMECPGNCDED